MNVHLCLGLLAWLGTVYFLFDKTWQLGDADFSGMLTTRRREDDKNESNIPTVDTTQKRRTKPGTLWRQDH
jgi:hypothetical protein